MRLKFLPPNTTSVSQPLDQGIIHNLKTKYRKLLIQSRLRSLDSNVEFSISILDAINMIQRAWGQVSSATITNCFRKAHFLISDTVETLQVNDNLEENDDELPDLFQSLAIHGVAPSSTTFEQYIECDSELAICGERSDSEIIALATSEQLSDSDIEKIDPPQTPPPCTAVQARNALDLLRSYLTTRSDSASAQKSLDSVENFLDSDLLRSRKQLTISAYFTKLQ